MKEKRINDRYELLRPVGGGGMADVYLAKDIILDREVAVKVLKPQFSGDEEFIRRFRREAQAATSLSHPNVVNIYDVGEVDDLYYIVMEYISGDTLKDYIQQKGKLSVEETVSIMEQITAAIGHAHENRIIHRDIKPHNILIGSDGQAKVTDFGIARAISEATITHTNSVLGSVHYLSPEQARGGYVTGKSDIYSLGIVMYEMLSGAVPFNGDTAVSVAIKHLQEPLPYLRDKDPSIPQSVENVVLIATAKDPQARYDSADQMAEDLAAVLYPERMNEKRVVQGDHDSEATKAVPVVLSSSQNDNEQTMIHNKPGGKDSSAGEADTGEKSNKKNEKKRGKKFWISAVAVSLAALIAIVAAIAILLPGWLRVNEVTIPEDLIGMEYEEAFQELVALELDVEQEFRFDEEVEEGIVLTHTPRAGETVKVGTRVTLVVSEGSEPVEMPNLVGESLSYAERMLENYENVELNYQESSEYDEDTVMTQSPEAESMVIPRETTVTLTVSERPVYIMANLYGMSRNEVLETLADNNLLLLDFTEEHHSTIEAGKVVSQDPPRGTEIRERTPVRVVFSAGPEPEPEPDPEPESEPEPEEQAEPDSEPEPENESEEQPISASAPLNVKVPDWDGDEEARPVYHISISVVDMRNDEPRQVIEKEINESERFYVDMEVAPGESGYLILYVDGEEFEESPYEYTYEELQQYE